MLEKKGGMGREEKMNQLSTATHSAKLEALRLCSKKAAELSITYY